MFRITNNHDFANCIQENIRAARNNGEPHTCWFVLSPENCGYLLSLSEGNPRVPTKNTREAYSRDMRNGAFTMSHQGAAIDVNGVFYDAHTRCDEAIKANVSLTLPISFGMPLEAKKNVDCGSLRAGHVQLGTTRFKKSIVQWLRQLDEGQTEKHVKYTAREMQETYLKYKTEFEILDQYKSVRSSYAPAMAVLFWCRHKGPAVVDKFIENLIEGNDSNLPSFVLRDNLNRHSNAGGARARQILYYTTNAIKKTVEGVPMRQVSELRPPSVLLDLDWNKAKPLSLDNYRKEQRT